MAILMTRTVVVPLWLLASALVAILAAPTGMVAAGLLLLGGGLAAAAIFLLGRNAVHPAVSTGLPTIGVRPLRVVAVAPQRRPSAAGPLSWPNSGFRNIGRGTKGG
jgi:hypothetical protein